MLGFVVLSLPTFFYLETEVRLLEMEIKQKSQNLEVVYEKNRRLKSEIDAGQNDDWQYFEELGLKKIRSVDIPIVEFVDDPTLTNF